MEIIKNFTHTYIYIEREREREREREKKKKKKKKKDHHLTFIIRSRAGMCFHAKKQDE
jgi:hypothetical protein